MITNIDGKGDDLEMLSCRTWKLVVARRIVLRLVPDAELKRFNIAYYHPGGSIIGRFITKGVQTPINSILCSPLAKNNWISDKYVIKPFILLISIPIVNQQGNIVQFKFIVLFLIQDY